MRRPSHFIAGWLAVWIALSCLPAAAQQRAAPAEAVPAAASAQTQAGEQLAAARNDVARLTGAVENARDDDNRLAELKVDVDAAAKRIIAISIATRPRLDEIKARLTELGEPPAEGAPAESDVVTAERERLIAERGEINALTGDAENLSIQATRLSNAITETRRALFTNTLLKYTDINTTVLSEAWTALAVEGDALSRSFSSWGTFVWKFKRLPLLTALFLSLCAALVFLSGSYRIFSPLIRRDVGDVEPGYITRLSVAFWSTMIPTTAAAAFVVSSYFFMQSFKVLRPDIAPIIAITLAVGVALMFIATLANAVLAPGQSNWRLVRVSDRGARLLVFAIIAMSVVNCLDYLLGGISEAMGSPIILTVVKSLFASVIIGLILMVMAAIRPMLPAGAPLDSPGRPWPRFASILLLLTGGALIAAALLGYVGLARFIATQIVVTSAIIVIMYIGILTGKAVAKQNAFAHTVVGRYFERRFGLGQVALDQAGLAAGLGIYALVVLFFIPLILLQWGFQIADIQAWTYRLLTDIRIGSITISLVGIFAGILLFAIGYIVTRWFQRWLDGSVMARSRVDAGVRNSIKTGVGYLGVGLAGLVGISAAGLDLSSLALVAGALSLGVGFGLQNIVSNFVSGLILLVERPFKVGDWVVTGTTEGFVKRISVRATEIETFQRQSIMVPNSLFINASVGNWTHRNKLGRSDISVVVGYDTAPRRAMDILREIAAAHPMVLRNPEPIAVFSAFGETTMTFELRIYLADIVNGIGVRNDLRVAIFERFKDENIGLPFPKEVVEPAPTAPGPVADAQAEAASRSGPVATEDAQPANDAAARGATRRRPRRISVETTGDA